MRLKVRLTESENNEMEKQVSESVSDGSVCERVR